MTKYKGLFFFLFPLSLLFLSLIFREAAILGVKRGWDTCVEGALPALFPALVLSGFLRNLPIQGRFRFFLPLLMGLVCGFPVGAYIVTEGYGQGIFTKKEAERLLLLTNGISPAFFIGFCGETVLGDVRKGWFLWAVQSLFSLVLFCQFFGKTRGISNPGERKGDFPNFADNITLALKKASNSFLYIVSCILFFSFLSYLIPVILKQGAEFRLIISLIFEVTGGVGNLKGVAPLFAFPLCAAACGFGGFSAHLQVMGALFQTDLSPKFYITGKVFLTLFMAVSAIIFQNLL